MIDKLRQIYMEGFSEDGSKYADYYCKKNVKFSVVYPQENPVSAGYILEKKLSNGQSCAYFSALATLKDERGKGNASALICKSLIIARKSFAFAVLSPFNSVFYKKFGFFTTQFYKKSIIFGDIILEEKIAQNEDLEDINQLFSNAIRPLINEQYLEDLKQETNVYGAQPVVLRQDGKTVGFCVKEQGTLSRVLLENIDITKVSNFNNFTIKNQTKNGEAFIQLRILSLIDFVKLLTPKNDFKVSLFIEDNILENNNGSFIFESKNGEIVAIKSTAKNLPKVNIGNLVEFLCEKGFIEKFKTQFIDEY